MSRPVIQSAIEAALQKPRLQFPLATTVACRGTEANCSPIVNKLFSGSQVFYFNDYYAVFQAIAQGKCRYGIFPLEEGGNNPLQMLCSFMQDFPLYFVSEFKMPVHASGFTRFVCIGKEIEFCEGANKISMLINLPNVSGSLYKFLAYFFAAQLNMTKIASWPQNSPNQFRFYFDFEGSIDDNYVLNLLGELEKKDIGFTFLGSYKAWE